jgi:hypothetical protein
MNTFLARLTALYFGAGLYFCAATTPETHVSPVDSLPLGSYQKLEAYGMAQVDNLIVSIHKWLPEFTPTVPNLYAQGEWWTQLDGMSGPYDEKTMSVLEFFEYRARLRLEGALPYIIEAAAAEYSDDPTQMRFLIDVRGRDAGYTYSYVIAQKQFRLMRYGNTYILPPDAARLEVQPYGYFLNLRFPVLVKNLSWATLTVCEDGVWQTYDSRDIEDPYDFYAFSVLRQEFFIKGNVAVNVPVKYAMGQCPGTLTLYYDEAGTIAESFDVQTGVKIVPAEPLIRLSLSAGNFTLLVQGASPSRRLAVETTGDFLTWSPFATIEDYTGLAWFSGIDMKSPQQFFRARVLP